MLSSMSEPASNDEGDEEAIIERPNIASDGRAMEIKPTRKCPTSVTPEEHRVGTTPKFKVRAKAENQPMNPVIASRIQAKAVEVTQVGRLARDYRAGELSSFSQIIKATPEPTNPQVGAYAVSPRAQQLIQQFRDLSEPSPVEEPELDDRQAKVESNIRRMDVEGRSLGAMRVKHEPSLNPDHIDVSSQHVVAELWETMSSAAAAAGEERQLKACDAVVPPPWKRQKHDASMFGRSTDASMSNAGRKPPFRKSGDDRFNVRNRDRKYVCDQPDCSQVVGFSGKQYAAFWGQYLHRASWKQIKVQELEAGYNDGTYDCTWLCVACFGKRLGITDEEKVAREIGVYGNETHRQTQWSKQSHR